MEISDFEKMFPGAASLRPSSFSSSFREKSLFNFQELSLFNQQYLLLEVKGEPSFFLVDQEAKRLEKLGISNFVFYFKNADRYLCDKLTRNIIPFMTSGGVAFIPNLLVVTKFVPKANAKEGKFSIFYQPVAELFLLETNLEANSKIIHEKISGISQSTIVVALRFLTRIGFLSKDGSRKNARYHLAVSPSEAFDIFEPYFSNPIKDTYYVEKAAISLEGYPYSSESALSLYTDIAENEVAKALSKEDFQKIKDIVVSPSFREANKEYVRLDV